MKKKIIIPIAALFLLTSCAAAAENTGEINKTSAPENLISSTAAATAQSSYTETTLSEKELYQIRAEKEAEYLHTLESLELDSEKIKQVNSDEIKNVDFTDCSVAVLSAYSEKILEYMSEETAVDFIGCITKAETSSEEFEVPKRTGGEHLSYQITLKTGEQIYIGTSIGASDEDMLVININHGYLCDRESVDKIREYQRDAYNRYDEALSK